MTTADATIVREEMERIVASGVLGRSRTYAKLLEYLVACSLEGRSPKELEIAVEVFGRGGEFDPSQDSLVRVYMHNLRQKLEQYGAKQPAESGYRLVIPRGEYRLMAEPIPESVEALPPPAINTCNSLFLGRLYMLIVERPSVVKYNPPMSSARKCGASRITGRP